MSEPTFGQKLAATIHAELGCFSDPQMDVAAGIIDRAFSETQGKLPGFSLEHSSPVRRGGQKEREVLFDALCGACGIPREGMTKPMARSVSVALTSIMAVMPTLSPNEIIIRAREYRRKHATWELTPNSLAKYWSTCATRESERGLLDEPAGWRSKHHLIFPPDQCGATGEMFSRALWEKIGRVYQEKIIRFCLSAPPQQMQQVQLPHAD